MMSNSGSFLTHDFMSLCKRQNVFRYIYASCNQEDEDDAVVHAEYHSVKATKDDSCIKFCGDGHSMQINNIIHIDVTEKEFGMVAYIVTKHKKYIVLADKKL